MSTQNIKLVNMTSTELYKLQVANIYGRLRHINNNTDGTTQFMPTHLGGVFGQKEILEGNSIMRQTRVTE